MSDTQNATRQKQKNRRNPAKQQTERNPAKQQAAPREERNPAKQQTIKRLLSYAGKSRGLLPLSLMLSGLSALVSFVPYIMVFFVMRDVISAVAAKEAVNAAALARYGLWAVGSAAAGFVLYYAALMLSHATAFTIQENLSIRMTETLAELPIGWHITHVSGKVRKVFEKNVNQLETLIAHNLPDTAQNMVSPFAILALMLIFDWRLGLISLLPLVLAFVLQTVLMRISSNSGFMQKYEDALEQMNNAGTEYVRGISVIKTFNQSVYYFKNFYTSIMNYKEFVHKYSKSWENGYSIFLALIKAGFLFLLPAALLIAGSATLDPRFFYSFVFYLAFAPVTYTMLVKIMYANSFNQRSNDALNRIEDILQAPLTKEPEKSVLPEKYNITFKDVVFSYKTETAGSAETDTGNKGRTAVNGISLHIPEHSLTALVGPSGGGKTTLVNLLGRFWEVDSGSISIGGVDIRDIKTSDLLHTVGFVFQENKLFKESIFENIRYGKKDASREEVMEALRKAECMDIIEKLPAGIDTVYGTKGTYVSGGEAQRLAIARALLQDAPIIVLDEATAFADAENEYKIKKTFDVLLKDKTVIMIAHRLSSVVNADKICVINEGKIAEEGTHNELLVRKGLYASMWDNFQKGIEWKV
ncbi:ABC transporter ATP-binding protein [Treponema lecithinolyticum]|uniref:ABC transporter, ATP-binding protein n=1 Tax=Treponema lecithinolyticum ATCC 700332 TaxID=1321815 RepID=A0ABN0NYJ2_TRELE|nr:ABC transporter ATP-binding protein [Treponema lecithinolyticum]ERJ93106.1 ABC transporter, ATP-binding protein [Treponema lecithinolyticum ATCC 700332]